MTYSDTSAAQWNLGAAFMGWLVPGLGHWLIGERRRAVILGVCIFGLWLGGLTIGGITVVDHKANPYWFLGQMLSAPSLVATQATQFLKERSERSARSLHRPSFGRVKEQGILYTALAGLLNLLTMIDLINRAHGSRETTSNPDPASRRTA